MEECVVLFGYVPRKTQALLVKTAGREDLSVGFKYPLHFWGESVCECMYPLMHVYVHGTACVSAPAAVRGHESAPRINLKKGKQKALRLTLFHPRGEVHWLKFAEQL